jgi:flagellar motility protein MotE (MotC chaperone)
MNGLVRELRLVPIVLIASACLLALKFFGLLLEGGYILANDDVVKGDVEAPLVRVTPDAPPPAATKQSWAQEMFNFPDVTGSVRPPTAMPRPIERGHADITGSVAAKPAEQGAKPAMEAKVDTRPAVGKAESGGKTPSGTPIDPAKPATGAERAILERLQERRQQLDARARELDIRESLIKAAEKRLEARLAEIKEVEGRIAIAIEKKDEAEAARMKGLVTMYENMKPRDAARIFDRLDIKVLLDVSTKLNPRRMSDILAQMSAETAERLTIEMANRSKQPDKSGVAALPKIEGWPNGP